WDISNRPAHEIGFRPPEPLATSTVEHQTKCARQACVGNLLQPHPYSPYPVPLITDPVSSLMLLLTLVHSLANVVVFVLRCSVRGPIFETLTTLSVFLGGMSAIKVGEVIYAIFIGHLRRCPHRWHCGKGRAA
ncbi:hypothetical protein J3E72DRAFT_410270, partial [Bipolaris maydis]|uniref:uncharacterized protein n=1 Tax=Cochliobolus heterostrophus TaxID=5016 RepID=UPI0024D0423C